mgnify:FL=1|jgi:hypothetical protein
MGFLMGHYQIEFLDMINISLPDKHRFLRGLFWLVFMMKALECLLPTPHGDALYYHLVAPKIWASSSWSEMSLDLSHYVQAGYFDLIYFIPFSFSDSLMKNQIAGQFLHFFFSIGLASLLCLRWVNHRVWGPLAAISMLTIARDSGFFHYAKNDGALALVSLVAAGLIYRAKYLGKDQEKFSLVVIGLMLGLVPSIKMSGLLVVLPLSLYFVWQNRYKVSNIVITGSIALLVFLPALAKNYIYTGNIFFPALVSRFPGFLTQPMLDHYSFFYGNPMTLDTFGIQIRDFLTGKFLFIIHPILMWLNYKSGRSSLNFFAWLSLAAFGLYLVFNGSLPHPRYFFSSYFLLVLFIFLSLKAMSEDPKTSSFFTTKTGLVLLILIVMSDAKLDLVGRNIRDAVTGHYSLTEQEMVRREIPLTALWDKIEANDSEVVDYVISDSYSSSYYLPRGVRLHTAKQSYGAEFLLDCHIQDDLSRLKFYRYSLLSSENSNLCYQFIRDHGTLLTELKGLKLYQNPTRAEL